MARHYLRKGSWYASRHARRRPRKGAKSVARRARYAKSAKAQSRQIATLGRSLVRLQKQSLRDATAISRYQIRIDSLELNSTAGIGTVNNKGIFVFPLTSCTATGTNAASSSFSDPAIKDGTWSPVQPTIGDVLSTSADKAAPAWIKMYKQHTRVAFHPNTINRSIRFDMFVVRLARDEETQSKGTMMQVLNEIDGVAFQGHPNDANRFVKNEDFYATSGWVGANPGGGTAPSTDPYGYDLVSMNSQRYKVLHKRQFVLGPVVNPVAPNPGALAIPAQTPAGQAPVHARDYYETSFTINYGGAKVMGHDVDVSSSKAPINITDITYSDLDPKLKHWIVLFPSRRSSKDVGFEYGVPTISMLSNITCRVPT